MKATKFDKQYVIRTLAEAYLWKVGEQDEITFNDWSLVLRRETDDLFPFVFAVEGKNERTCNTWGHRYCSMEDALLHIANNFNENAQIQNRYNTLHEYITN